jgi:hypothetical protein
MTRRALFTMPVVTLLCGFAGSPTRQRDLSKVHEFDGSGANVPFRVP